MLEILKTLKETLICLALILLGWILPNPYSIIAFISAIMIGGYEQTKTGILDTLENKRLNVELLMILSAIGACLIGDYQEGAILIFIFSLSGSLETLTLDHSQHEIRSLMRLQPQEATRRLPNGETELVAVQDLKIGDILIVQVGKSVPTDGKIIEGTSSLEEAAITGESMPREKSIGDLIYGGTINLSKPLVMEVTHSGDDILIQKIIRMVEEAESHPSKVSIMINRIENIYAQIVLIVVTLLILIPWLIMHQDFHDVFYRAMVLLVVASPCALIASVTPATLSAISNGAKKGILVKGGMYFEAMMDTKAIAFDKTGTLTQGIPVVTDLYFKEGVDFNILLSIEQHSTHPLASALVKYLGEKKQAYAIDINDIEEKPGLGISGQAYRLGSLEFVGVADEEIIKYAQHLSESGKSLVYVAKNEKVVGIFGLSDKLRPESKSLMDWLNNEKIDTIMITGDTERTAQKLGSELGMSSVIAGCLPQDKVTRVKELEKEYGQVMMIGDGINDAPALANASIGVAMSGGTDIAIETADLILVKNDLGNIRYGLELSRRLRKIIVQNIVFALSVIVVLVSLTFMNNMNLPVGVVGHEGSTILVILNSLRLLKPLKTQ